MKVSQCMTRDVKLMNPKQTLREAAQCMAELDVGVLPVGENDRLVGMITDRDIAIRAVAQGKGADTQVRDAMTEEVKYCYEDDDVDQVARNMGEQQLRRMPVLSREKRLVGIIALGDIACARKTDSKSVGQALGDISRSGGQHSQSAGHSSARH